MREQDKKVKSLIRLARKFYAYEDMLLKGKLETHTMCPSGWLHISNGREIFDKTPIVDEFCHLDDGTSFVQSFVTLNIDGRPMKFMWLTYLK